jgi:hypothetical protein
MFNTASIASINSDSMTGLLLPMLKMRNGALLVAGSGCAQSQFGFGRAMLSLARI